MADVFISVENLSKRYLIRRHNGRDHGLRHVIQHVATAPFRWFSGQHAEESASAKREPFYALRHVTFDVERGEVVGIVGRNGAGKSTLLKVLSQITEPTEGRVRIKRRVASLLEVGTGFHPELTGRENIFVNGAILGMTRREINRKFDEIVDFSGIEKFLDMPVKQYSSGMAVRLAFAVAAHLEPEILLVDEVLAVGDAEFQKKCLDKLHDVTRSGRTILFVSHNLVAMRNLCPRVLVIDRGRLVMDASATAAIAAYLDQNLVAGAEVCGDELDAKAAVRGWDGRGNHAIHCRAIRLLDIQGQRCSEFRSDESMIVEIEFECSGNHRDLRVAVSVVTVENQSIVTTQNVDEPDSACYRCPPGTYRSRCTFPGDLFGENRYYVSVMLALPHVDYLAFERILAFDVTFVGYNNIQYMNDKQSLIRPRLRWEVCAVSAEEHVGC